MFVPVRCDRALRAAALVRACVPRALNNSQSLLPPHSIPHDHRACAQVDAGFHAHRAGATWGCSSAAAEQAAALALYSVTVCIADTSDAVAAASDPPPLRGGWAQALQRAVAIVRIVSAVSDMGVTLEFFHSGVSQSAVRREEDVVALFQRAAAIMKSVAGGADRARFQGVFGLESIKAGTPRDQIKYVCSSVFLHYIYVTF